MVDPRKMNIEQMASTFEGHAARCQQAVDHETRRATNAKSDKERRQAQNLIMTNAAKAETLRWCAKRLRDDCGSDEMVAELLEHVAHKNGTVQATEEIISRTRAIVEELHAGDHLTGYAHENLTVALGPAQGN